jgi:hypothetical protein
VDRPWVGEGVVGLCRIRRRTNRSRQRGLHLAEPHAGSLVERPVRHDDSATPVATAIAACWTVAHAAPPP